MTLSRARLTELAADGLGALGDKLGALAQASIDAADQLDCIVPPAGARF